MEKEIEKGTCVIERGKNGCDISLTNMTVTG
jgi:hypothetical protein